MNDLSIIYQERFSNTGIERRKTVWRALCRYFFSRYIRPSDRVLDIACGYGEFINNIVAREKFAIDLNPDSASRLDHSVHFINKEATNLSSFADSCIDVAFSSNFLEHLPAKSDIVVLLRDVYRVLTPGGKLILLGPNIKYAFREYWDFFDHHIPLSDASIGEALQLAGFKVEITVPRFLPFTMNNTIPVHDILIRLYLSFPFVWSLFGKQFLIVAGKAQ
ncbi:MULTISPECIES: class I SAM-dependent methyltransferase [Methylosinus]|uniref:Class I SAM-dependent methyltransferase n=1 Tax=Methylosinus trichosporium (strain ATCC 35070 / NCIMB 11131 / UNIQEM 75 / OB3b) TaxID=595536 RepID=A0A2D2CYS5_METT3|nr:MULTISPECIES: class I SAM-dependent methyltransferase [Methylosinus]ATQ67882.1 class I SAM-dependent methyltransferase [Methylosinus trichosporium OB3b]